MLSHDEAQKRVDRLAKPRPNGDWSWLDNVHNDFDEWKKSMRSGVRTQPTLHASIGPPTQPRQDPLSRGLGDMSRMHSVSTDLYKGLKLESRARQRACTLVVHNPGLTKHLGEQPRVVRMLIPLL